MASGADVILIPEIPYDVKKVAEAITRRSRGDKRFSIVAVAEGSLSKQEAAEQRKAEEARKAEKERRAEKAKGGKKSKRQKEEKQAKRSAESDSERPTGHALSLAEQLEELTGLESRVTILGHLQRGGTPSAADRFLATRLGTACAQLIQEGHYGVMVAARGEGTEPVPLEDVVGKRKTVPLDHPWLESARAVGTNLGD